MRAAAVLLVAWITAALTGCAAGTVPTQAGLFGVTTITKEEVRPRIGSPGLVLIDVRHPDHWAEARSMIAGAVREDPEEVSFWAPKYSKETELVLYCD